MRRARPDKIVNLLLRFLHLVLFKQHTSHHILCFGTLAAVHILRQNAELGNGRVKLVGLVVTNGHNVACGTNLLVRDLIGDEQLACRLERVIEVAVGKGGFHLSLASNHQVRLHFGIVLKFLI